MKKKYKKKERTHSFYPFFEGGRGGGGGGGGLYMDLCFLKIFEGGEGGVVGGGGGRGDVRCLQVVKASTSRAEDPEFEFRLRRHFSRSSHTSDLKIGTSGLWLPCHSPGVIGSALGLVGPMSVYCNWVRLKV